MFPLPLVVAAVSVSISSMIPFVVSFGVNVFKRLDDSNKKE
jgi:ribonuclease HIII